ncbi:MAG: hybrid sensor histidine kinase/response regulator [Cellvibrionaceae bacterium]|nr:hybrid sensor histidine kinase/response regulator [Cellvibrionaceae bacterium]
MRLPITSKSLAFKIQQLSVMPVLICITLIAIGIAAVQAIDTRDLEHKRNAVATRWLSSLVQHAITSRELTPASTEYILASFDDLLEMPSMRGTYLLDSDGKVILKRGQRLSLNLERHLSEVPTQWGSDENYYYATPIIDVQTNGASVHRGWLVVSINHAGLSIKQYKGLSVILAALLLAFTVLTALAWRLTRTIESPLHEMQSALQDFSQRKFKTRVSASGATELQYLANSINELGKRLEEDSSSVRQQIDQATSDLQETLDTVEIQSIELDLARKRAVEANRSKSQFLANTTHEIRTPINGILGFTSLLLKSPLTTQQREYLRTIAHSSQGLLTIINDILDFSRLEEDRLTLDKAPLNLRQVIEETLQVLAPAASEKQLYLIANNDGEVPLHLHGDALRLKQVLTNLVSNAIKFSDTGNVVIQTQLIATHGNLAEIKICVNDCGIGIDQHHKDSVFEAFKQADASDSRQRGGTGLGLAIAKGLVEKMGGKIGIENNSVKGTTAWFSLSLPVQQRVLEESGQLLAGKRAVALIPNAPLKDQLSDYLAQWNLGCEYFPSQQALTEHCDIASAENTHTDLALIIPENQGDANSLLKFVKNSRCGKTFIAVLPDSPLAYNESLQHAGAHIVFLPLSHDHLYQVLTDSFDEQPAQNTSTPTLEQPKNVLVVDDNPANLQLVSTFLDSLGVNVLEANSGKEALSFVANAAVDLVFMDVQMPQMDGIETTQRIRAEESEGSRIPIIALTAHDMSEQKAKLIKAGMDDYTSKPVSEEQLAHLLRQWLNIESTPSQQTHSNLLSMPLGKGIPQNAIMDLQDALRLSNGKRDLARDMLMKLTADLGQEAEEISQLFQQQQWSELQEKVHRLYGGCCYCGVPELRLASGELDSQLIKGDHSKLADSLNNLLKAIQRLREWVEDHDLDIIFDTEEENSNA